MTQTEWIISLDDDLKDFDELFVGNVRDGERLIRCKDCEHFLTDGKTHICYHFAESVIFPEPNDYCSRAERKEE